MNDAADTTSPVESPLAAGWRRFHRDRMARYGLIGIILLVAPALLAPLLANGRPLLLWDGQHLTFPFLRYFFAPDGSETAVDTGFNYFLLFLLLAWAVCRFCRSWRTRSALLIITA
jgi:ABC-type microcin C transport system permease subunit YejE